MPSLPFRSGSDDSTAPAKAPDSALSTWTRELGQSLAPLYPAFVTEVNDTCPARCNTRLKICGSCKSQLGSCAKNFAKQAFIFSSALLRAQNPWQPRGSCPRCSDTEAKVRLQIPTLGDARIMYANICPCR